MSAIRTTSQRATRLAAKASPYNSAVTPENEAGPSTSRRSTRRRVKQENNDPETRRQDDGGVDESLPVLKKSRTRKKVDTSTAETTQSVVAVANLKSESPKKMKVVRQSLDVPHPAPMRWKEAYDAIKEMRSRIVAPVDTMGCEQAQYKEQDPKNQRFATLISLMLSSQTKDEVTDAAVAKLRSALGGSISVDALIAADETAISEAIAKVGFWRRKTQYIRQTAQRLRDNFESDVPKTVDELCSLPGVGPKMAFLALQVAWKLNVGIGVDVHVHRITNRLGWHRRETKNPEETRLNLQSWLPKELHGEINHLLVGFGQMVCLPLGPKCDSCTLSSEGLCPSARTPKPSRSRTVERKLTVDVRAGSGPKIEIELESAENLVSLPSSEVLSPKGEEE
ncbi:DNA glycosylase [Phlebopus sp. FC_14]|nr:DNA glycosylase [Phlebopus sp. FC_14]